MIPILMDDSLNAPHYSPKIILICRKDYSAKMIHKDALRKELKNRNLDDYFLVVDFGHNKARIFPWNITNPFYHLDHLQEDFEQFCYFNR